MASKLFFGNREYPYKVVYREAWFCNAFSKLVKHPSGSISIKYYRENCSEDYIDFKTAIYHLQPQLFQPVPPAYKDSVFNDFVRIYNLFGAEYIFKTCGGLEKINKAHCIKFLTPILQAIQPDPSKMRDIEKITNCYNIEPNITAYMMMDFSILTYSAREFNNKNVTVVRKQTQSVIKRYIQNIAKEKQEISMLTDFLRSFAKVLCQKEPHQSVLQMLASEIQGLDVSIDAFSYIKQKLNEA
ncbi:hypothetical protein FGO68_gene7622 [Halteria grandinella]|uniref:Uncharacterized protein n=1 Tax=Halteria grandinella TaxID=5974 RepID=A0A8J8NVS9_HALGN|nr:hypothetical protein FGO68_gene7622 [Halteria grandinella]